MVGGLDALADCGGVYVNSGRAFRYLPQAVAGDVACSLSTFTANHKQIRD